MDLFICIVLLLVGLVLIVKGGDFFVDAASWIAKVSGIPTFVIGATIVSLATTLPEILVSSISAATGSVEIAIGNAVGSVNANVALIMGISLFCMPAVFDRKAYLPKSILLLVAVGTLWACSSSGNLPLGLAFVVLTIFVVFIIENLLSAKKSAANEEKTERYKPKDKKEIIKNIVLFVLGAAGIAGGAMLLSTYGEKLAYIIGDAAGIPTEVMAGIVGVTIIAVGTSLPELTTTIIAIKKKQSELSVGNIVGANIIDITLILPLCSMISGGSLPVANQSLYFDMPFCLIVCAVALVPSLIRGKFARWQGATLLVLYAAYLTFLLLNTFGVVSLF